MVQGPRHTISVTHKRGPEGLRARPPKGELTVPLRRLHIGPSSGAVFSSAGGGPEILEAPWTQLGIPHRVLNVLVAKVKLNRAGVLAGVGQVKAGRVPEHVRVNGEFDAGRFARRCNYKMDCADR